MLLLLKNSPVSEGLQEVPPSVSWLTFRQAIHASVKASATRSSANCQFPMLISTIRGHSSRAAT